MDEDTPTGMQQQLVQLAAQAMMSATFGENVPPTFAGGLAMNLVIDLFEEVNTRVDGDTSGRKTDARSGFVSGGDPEGGALPVNSAESRWREHQGEKRFVSLLRRAQKDGAEEKRQGKSKRGYFLLEVNNEKHVISAPILGGAPTDTTSEAPPASLQGDYQEFLRAYKCAFTHWLAQRGAGKPKDSAVAFARLLAALGPDGEDDFFEAIERIYGTGLAGDDESLEGRFLVWLSKQKAAK